MLIDKEVITRLVTEECHVLKVSYHPVPEVDRLFHLHKCDWMAQDLQAYNEEVVPEFYASYVATIRGSIHKRSKPPKQDLLASIIV